MEGSQTSMYVWHTPSAGTGVQPCFWAMLQSDLALVDLASSRVVTRHRGFWHSAHGVVLWRRSVISLDSDRGRLVSIDAALGQSAILWQVCTSGL